MIVTLPFLREKFARFNREIFRNELPAVGMRLSRARTFSGLCHYKTRRNWMGRKQSFDYELRFSIRFDKTEEEWEDVLIHEMIHYYLAVKGQTDRTAHGPHFREMMQRINTHFNRHISISERLSQEEAQKLRPAVRHKWRVVACLTMADGTTAVKVLPKIAERILTYYNQALASGLVTAIALFFSDDDYFARFPASAALKYYPVPAEELAPHLRRVTPIRCDGRSVVVEEDED